MSIFGLCNRTIDRLSEWVRTWQMKFSVGKCEMMHFGWMNQKIQEITDSCILNIKQTAEETAGSESICGGK